MVEMSEPAHLTDMAVEIGVKRGLWGQGKSSVYITIENKHCNKGGVAVSYTHLTLPTISDV